MFNRLEIAQLKDEIFNAKEKLSICYKTSVHDLSLNFLIGHFCDQRKELKTELSRLKSLIPSEHTESSFFGDIEYPTFDDCGYMKIKLIITNGDMDKFEKDYQNIAEDKCKELVMKGHKFSLQKFTETIIFNKCGKRTFVYEYKFYKESK